MAVQAELGDADAQQRTAHLLHRFGAFRVQLADVVAEQHLIRQAELPAVVSQLEALRLQQRDLLGRQALRLALAAGERQQGDEHHRQQ